MLCYFAQKFPSLVADFLQVSEELSRRFREESVTDMMMANLKMLGGAQVFVEFPDEPKTGADMEWVFFNKYERNIFRLLIQAKKIYGKKTSWRSHYYKELYHRVHGSQKLQADLLVATAQTGSATFPLYVFYHRATTCTFANTASGLNDVLGVNFASGFDIHRLVVGATTSKTKAKNKRLGTIRPFLFSMEDLFCPMSLRATPILGLAPGFLGPFFIARGLPTSHVGLPDPPMPKEIRDRLIRVLIGKNAGAAATVPELSTEIPMYLQNLVESPATARREESLRHTRITFVSTRSSEQARERG